MARRPGQSRRRLFRFGLIALAVLAVGALGFLIWASAPAGDVMPPAREALESSQTVHVTHERWLVFAPRDGSPSQGFIFYPGGKVPVEAYAPLGSALAEAGHLAVLVPMPLNLAILDPAAASAVVDANPAIETWVIGGHSLGGVMAARYAYSHPDQIRGLALMAAYPEAGVDLSEATIAVASIYAELDGLASIEEIESSFARLPADSAKILIAGGNHAQFGWYGPQSGDNPAAISHQAQYDILIDSTLALMAKAGNPIKFVLD